MKSYETPPRKAAHLNRKSRSLWRQPKNSHVSPQSAPGFSCLCFSLGRRERAEGKESSQSMRAGVQGQTEDRKSFLRGEEVKDRRSPPLSTACLMPQMQTVGWVGGSSGGVCVWGGGFTIKKNPNTVV